MELRQVHSWLLYFTELWWILQQLVVPIKKKNSLMLMHHFFFYCYGSEWNLTAFQNKESTSKQQQHQQKKGFCKFGILQNC